MSDHRFHVIPDQAQLDDEDAIGREMQAAGIIFAAAIFGFGFLCGAAFVLVLQL